MKNNQQKQGDKVAKRDIKSLFCYGNEKVKKMIWSLKTNPRFCNTENGEKLIKIIRREIQNKEDCSGKKIIVVCAPSSSFWQNKKDFDHMHSLMKAVFKGWHPLSINPRYIPYAIIPHLNKDSQKILNKKERQEQSRDAYALSGYFKYLLRKDISKDNSVVSILVIDDVKTTGSTVNECIRTIEKHAKKYSSEVTLNANGLTIAYEA